MLTPWQTLCRYRAHDGTLADFLASRAEPGPDRTFLVFLGERGERSWTYRELAAASSRLARGLGARGIGKGDRIAVMAPNSDATVVLLFAAARLGAILVPVNPELGPSEAGYILDHAAPSAIVVTPETAPVVRAAGATELLGLEGPVEGAPALLSLEGQADLPTVSGGEVGLILYTSGTTGFPKGVMHAQRSFTLAGEGFVERMELQPDDRLLCVLPLFHVNALFYSLGGALAAGASLVLARRFSASGFWRLAAETGATEVNIIAAVGNILARRPRSEFVPGHRLAKVYGAPVSPELAAILTSELGVSVVIEGYGMTEIPGAASVPFRGPHKPGSMGRAARHPDRSVAFAELRVVDEDGRDLPDGEVGELLVRTPIVMTGYFRDPAATAAAFHDGWFATGDLARRDADGDLFFVARKKDIIRRRGENVSGAELDRILALHPAVAEAAAVAVPAELGEDEILAVVVARPGVALSAPEVAAWCAQNLAASKVPRYVAIVDELPHTPTHRVAKFKLRGDPDLLARAVDLGGKR